MAGVCVLPPCENQKWRSMGRMPKSCRTGENSNLALSHFAPLLPNQEKSVNCINAPPLTMEEYQKVAGMRTEEEREIARLFPTRIVKTFSYSVSKYVPCSRRTGPANRIGGGVGCTAEIEIHPKLAKYWRDRHKLFHKFDDGIQLDEEGLYSVTPEALASHQALRCEPKSRIVDGFTGVGGNAIQYALQGHHVVAIDNDPAKIKCAEVNARIYGVQNLIQFVVGDFFEIAPKLHADLIFLSPPWGGVQYRRKGCYDLKTMLQPKDGKTLFRVARRIAPKIVMFLPRNTNLVQLEQLSIAGATPMHCEVELNHVDGRARGVTAYYEDFGIDRK